MKMDAIICPDHQEGHRPVYKEQTTGTLVKSIAGKIDSITLSTKSPTINQVLTDLLNFVAITNHKIY